MINYRIVECVDRTLDSAVSSEYKDQPLAQDWARVAKVSEELGEAIAELIIMTGQNPRKRHIPEHRKELLDELADLAMTAVYAIQHFTKSTDLTAQIMIAAQEKHHDRLCPA